MVILSSPIGFAGSVIRFESVSFPQKLEGDISYVGHPATRELLESLGATTSAGKWDGPEVGESYLAVPLLNNSREGGYTKDVAVTSTKELTAIKCTRIG